MNARAAGGVFGAIVGALMLAMAVLVAGGGQASAQEPEGIFEFSADGVTWSEDPGAVLPPFSGATCPRAR